MLSLYVISQSPIDGFRIITPSVVNYNPIGIPLIITGQLVPSVITETMRPITIKAKLESLQLTGRMEPLLIRAEEENIQLGNF